MSPDLEKSIIEKHPSLFANIGQKGSPMNFGLEVGDGWAGIISTMCFILDQKDADKKFRFDQIKEKWGLLRIYISGGNDYMAGVVRMAEDISGTVCEMCGRPGSQRKGGWIKTLCDGCHSLTQAHEKSHEKRDDCHMTDLSSQRLTAEERDAVEWAIDALCGVEDVSSGARKKDDAATATLRGLLERTRGER